MAYIVEWGNPEKTIIKQTYIDEIDVEEYIEAVQTSADLMKSVAYPVDIIIDFTQASINMVGYMQGVRQANQQVPDNQNRVIVIGLDMVTSTFVNVVRRIAPRAFRYAHFVKNTSQAYKILEQDDT